MKTYDSVAGWFLTVVSVGTSVLAYRLGLGTFREPGPGLIPFWAAVLLGVMSIGMIITSLPKSVKVTEEEKVFGGISWKTLILVVCSLLGYGIAFNILGFNTCTFLLMVVFLRGVSRRKWWLTLTMSFLTVIGTYLIFVVLLGCQFPVGPFGI